jgi:hypothetical protein
MPKPPQRHRQAGRVAGGKGQMRTGILQGQSEGQRPDPVQHYHGGNVQRHLQRVARRHRALELAIEIARRIIAETGGHILHPAGGMQDQIVERQAIDEGLERGAR